MTIYDTLLTTGLPVRYSHFDDTPDLPYLVYIGGGQNQFRADDTTIWKSNTYQVEYYFSLKNEAQEDLIESTLLDAGFRYEKSDDTFIEDEGVFVIYYQVN